MILHLLLGNKRYSAKFGVFIASLQLVKITISFHFNDNGELENWVYIHGYKCYAQYKKFFFRVD